AGQGKAESGSAGQNLAEKVAGASAGAGFFAARRESGTTTAQTEDAVTGASQIMKVSVLGKYLSGGAGFWFERAQQNQRLTTVGTMKRLSHCRWLNGDGRLAIAAGDAG